MSEPTLAFDIPFKLGMTVYLMTESTIREIETSEETHEIEMVECQKGTIPCLARKQSGCSTELSRFAASPIDAYHLKIRQAEAKLNHAQRYFMEDCYYFTRALDQYYKDKVAKATESEGKQV